VICVDTNATLVGYYVTNLGGSQFEYEYTINNNSLSVAIQEFTIWFDVQLCDNLTITTQEPLASQWSEMILENTGFGLPIGYDAKVITGGIQPTEALHGFSISFDWFGMGMPDSQYYEIVDPEMFVTIDSGYTIPEPSAFLLLGLGSLALRAKRKLNPDL
jgi:hypothetical protein